MNILFLISVISSNMVIGAVGTNLDILLGTYDCTKPGDIYPLPDATTGIACEKYVKCSDDGKAVEADCDNTKKPDEEKAICVASPDTGNCKYTCPPFGFSTGVFTSVQGTASPYYGLCYNGKIILQRICRPQGSLTTVFDPSTRECIPSCTTDSPNKGDECATFFLQCINNFYVKSQCPPDFFYSAAQNGCSVTCNGTTKGPNNSDNTTIKPNVTAPTVTPSRPTNVSNRKTTPRRF